MATIHKLTKDGATIFPATITDAVVHQDTGKTLTSMIKEYNVSELFPTEGIAGGNTYNLALAVQVLGTHLRASEKTGGIKLTFISSVFGGPVEEYYLGKNTWSAVASDWKQRFEVGEVIMDPAGDWEPSTAEAYIDQQVATITNDLSGETVARQTADTNLQNQVDTLAAAVGTGGTVDQRIQAEATTRANADTALSDRITPLEQAVGTGGSIDTRISNAKSEIIGNATSACDTLGEAEAKINANTTAISNEASIRATADEQLRQLYENLTQSDVIVGPRPSSGQLTNVIYREPDQGHTPPQNYSDYMWYNNGWVLMATYDNAIDDEPTSGSDNLVKSGGVYASYSTIYSESASEFAKVAQYIRNIYIIPLTETAYNILKSVTDLQFLYIGASRETWGNPFGLQISCSEGSIQKCLSYIPDISKNAIVKLDTTTYATSDFVRSLDIYVEFVANADFDTQVLETVRTPGVYVKSLDMTSISLFKEILRLSNSDDEPKQNSTSTVKSYGIWNMFTTFKSTSPEELVKVTQYLKNLYLIPRTPEDSNILKSITDLRISFIGCGGSTWKNHPFGLQIAGTYNGENAYINKHLTYIPELSKNTIVKLNYTDGVNGEFLRNLTIYADFSENADFVTEKEETIRGNGVYIKLDTSFVSLFKDIVKEELVYTVYNNGDGDFLNLKECIDYINTLGGFPKVTIRVGNGTYNMRSWYTDEEWNAIGFQGLVIPRNVTIEGIGQKRSDVVINCISETPMSEVSALHLTDNATIKNLTVYASNVRYVVHDDESDYDFANENGSYRHIENCDFIAENTQRNFVYGAGTKGGADWYFKNCRFINKGSYTPESGVFSVHDMYDPQSETQSYKDERYVFEDCEFIGHHQSDFRICPANGGVEETIILKRCKLKKVYVTSGYTGFSDSTTIFNVIGSANSKDIKWGYRAAAMPSQGVVYNERKTIPCFSDTTISGINCDTEAISVGDYCKYDEHYGIIKGTENDNIGIALLGANVGDVVYVSKDYEFTYIGI